MKKKSINFFKTSNKAIEISEMRCHNCEGIFYEIDGSELLDCPLCNFEFSDEPNRNDIDSDSYTLIVDHRTGIPTVIKNADYVPVLKEVPNV